MNHPVLVACPTYAGKEYALDEFLAAYIAQTYRPRHLFMVDNTRRFRGYYELLAGKGLDVARLTPFAQFQETFWRCWELIAMRARHGGFWWVMSVEQDNIIPPDTISRFVALAEAGDLDMVTHTYPVHQAAKKASGIPDSENLVYQGLGCTLMSLRLLEKTLAEPRGDVGKPKCFELSFWHACDRYASYACLQNQLDVGHLDKFSYEFPNHNRDITPEEYEASCPTPVPPDDYGTTIPPAIEAEVVAAGLKGKGDRWFLKE